ncbi:pH nine-sensitive protein 1 [Sporothrix bragantina]|uniref:Protein PNS1 n=1 Tax=Sporothrix bragantina TaxID=671064 RepID=A0ABP0B2Q0_9PEZI
MANNGEAAAYYNNDPEQGREPPPVMNGRANGNRGAPPEQQGYYPPGQDKQQPPGGYDQQQPQPGAPQDNFNMDQKQDYDQVFAIQGPKYRDIWAGLLFLATFAGFVAVSGIAIHGYATTRSGSGGGIYDSTNTFGLTTNTVICLVICVAVAIILSLIYMWIARQFTKLLIWVTGIANICLGLATAIYMLYQKYWSGGIVFLVFVVFTIICFISWIPRIPFSVVMLQGSMDVARRRGHVFIVSLVGGLVGAAFGIWFSITMVAVYVKYEPGNNPACDASGGGCSQAKVIGLMVFITFAGYWISEWLKNTIHATVAGIYGSWYFSNGDANFPRGATRSSARRALTYSFGSISLGSLIVAIINFLRQLCSIAQQQAAGSGDTLASIFFCLLGCFISILDWAVQFVNRYAFCHIALYGSSYFEAAKNTWTMIKNRGIDALVNQCLIGPVFSMGATFVAYATSLSAYVFLHVTKPAYNDDGSYTPVILAYAFLVGLQICNIFTTPISSGVDTIFVAMGWDPHVLYEKHNDLYQRMVEVYPRVQQAIQG